MAFIKEHKRGEHTYYELVEGYRDEEGKVRHRQLKWLGKTKTIPPDEVTIEGLDFAQIAHKLIDETLTSEDVFELLDRIGTDEVDIEALEAVGIGFDLAQKKLTLFLLPKGFTWTMRPPDAPSAGDS